ncbi:MAG: hypothetical protein P4K98_10010 [Bryobacteraceae bacterium]|nr:hypothetical protein [Bryobacteraceae bacterium]
MATVQTQSIPLRVPAGAPLRLFLTKRVPKRMNAPVEARLLAPLYAFDHEVLPAGTQVFGRVGSVQPVSKWTRARALLGGDFTPLHVAKIEFDSVTLSGGRKMAIGTIPAVGLNSLVPLRPPKARKPASNPTGTMGKATQAAKDQVAGQVDRVRSIPDLVRGPDKRERVIDFLMAKLPYHPQYVRKRTRFDAELKDPLDFGSETVKPDSLALLGTQPAPGSVAHVRLLTALDSRHSTKGEKVEATLTEPLFGSGHMLVLPEGTRLEGSVVLAKRAGWFHRGGRLMFNFQNVVFAPGLEQLARAEHAGNAPQQPRENLQFRTRASVAAVESGDAPLKVDEEGGVRTTESKKRFLSTAAALLIAQRAADNDAGRRASGGQSSNAGGRTVGGAMGFGLLGSVAGRLSTNTGMALGYYGLAWSVFSTVAGRGAEVEFGKNAVVDVGFSTRPPGGRTELTRDAAKAPVK